MQKYQVLFKGFPPIEVHFERTFMNVVEVTINNIDALMNHYNSTDSETRRTIRAELGGLLIIEASNNKVGKT
jgi:hypothetical protein